MSTDESLHVRRRSTSHHSSQHHDSSHQASTSSASPANPSFGVANQVAILTAMLNERETALEAANNRSSALMSELAASRSETSLCRQKAEELATALSVSCERTHSVMRLVESNNQSHTIEMKRLKDALALQQERFDVAMEVDQGVASLYLSLKAHAAHINARGLGGAARGISGGSSSSFALDSEDIISAPLTHPLALLQTSSDILHDVSRNVVSTSEVTEFLKAVISVRSAILAKKDSSSNSLQAVVATIRATGTMPRGVVDYLMGSGLVGTSSGSNNPQPTATIVDPKAASSPKRIAPSQGSSSSGELTGEMHFLLHSKLSKTDVPALHDLIDGLRAALEAQIERAKESLRRHLQEVSLLVAHYGDTSSKGVQAELAALRLQLRELEVSAEVSSKELRTLRDSKNICRHLEKERDAATMEAEKHAGRANAKDRLLKEAQETLAMRLKEHAHQMSTLSLRASEATKLSSQNVALTAEVETLRGQLARLDVRGLKGARDRAEEISLRKEAALADATKLNLEHERRLASLKEANERMALEYTAIFKAHVAATQKQEKRRVAEDMSEASQFIVGSQSPLAAEHYLRKYQDAMSELHAAQRKLRHLLILSHHDQSSSATRITHLESELEETKRRKGAGWDGSDAFLDGSNVVDDGGDDGSITLDNISLVGTSSSPTPADNHRSMLNSASTSQHRLRRAGSALQQRRSLYNNSKTATINPALLADIVDNVTISPLARTVSLATTKERRTSVVVGSSGSRRSSSPSGNNLMSPAGAPLADVEPDTSSLTNNRQFSASDLPNYNTRQDLHSLHQRLTKEKVTRGTARLNVGGEHQHMSPTSNTSNLSSKARRLVSKGLESKTVRRLDNVVLGAMLEKGSDCGSDGHSDNHPEDEEEVMPPPHEVSYRSVPSRATQRTFDLISSPMGRRPASSGGRGSSQSPTPDPVNTKPPSAGVITGRTPVRLGLAPSRRSDRTKK